MLQRQTIIDDLHYLEDWQERYRYLIDLGKQLPPLPEADKVDGNLVRGCMSRVWLLTKWSSDEPRRLSLMADSDALIVRGLVALLLTLVADRTPAEVLATDVDETLASLGLDKHLSRGRSDGLRAMVQRIRELAASAARP